MSEWTYYINNLWFEVPVDDGFESFYADVLVNAEQSEFGSDADGNRSIWITEREAVIESVRNLEGRPVSITKDMIAEVQSLIEEKGSTLEWII